MDTPNIEGTYQLVRRELPDGAVQLPLAVKGMITLTKEFRNFSVVWKDDEGKFYSECYVARYTLTDKEYTETSEYLEGGRSDRRKRHKLRSVQHHRYVPGVLRRGTHQFCFAA